VDLGIDCIFDASIPAYLVESSVSLMRHRRVEGLMYQVLIHTYDAVLLFGLRNSGDGV
jgi:hypothetical protein